MGLRVADLDRSLAFYTSVGYEVLGRVPETPFGSLTMLKLPGDEFVTIELVHDPDTPLEVGNTLNHLVIKVESMAATLSRARRPRRRRRRANVAGRVRWRPWPRHSRLRRAGRASLAERRPSATSLMRG
jgi:catechol 2,3-dioxygenase-like lactoylglutathione lyase family enzyme